LSKRKKHFKFSLPTFVPIIKAISKKMVALNLVDPVQAAESGSVVVDRSTDISRCGTPSCAWREKVSQWCYDVADHLNEDRSIVYVAMTILDRYCETFTSPIDEKKYEISSLSSIFLAVHISGSGDLTLSELISMSRGGIAVKDILDEATIIASAISLNEPILTPVDYVRSALLHITTLNDSLHKQAILDAASYMIELAVCDSFFMNCKASTVAVAALLNALELVVIPNYRLVTQALIKISSQTVDSKDNLMLHRRRLSCIYSHSVDHLPQSVGPHVIEDDDEESCTTDSRAASIKRDYSIVDSDQESFPCKRLKMEL
jgi:hypothetical protein